MLAKRRAPKSVERVSIVNVHGGSGQSLRKSPKQRSQRNKVWASETVSKGYWPCFLSILAMNSGRQWLRSKLGWTKQTTNYVPRYTYV